MSTALQIPTPRKAEKKRVKLKLAIQGPSGSGKTWGALALAKNLWPNAKVCLIDTENESASLYADTFEFDTIPLTPPFHTDRYGACIDAVIAGGYDVCIIDSLSHQWDGDGGILRRKEDLDQRPGANSYTNWSKFTPEHSRFKEKVVQAPIHIIATMRSKQDYILETNDRGKSQPRKVGMAPIQRDGFDYEFSLVFDVQMDHKATVDKNRTGLFDGEVLNLADPKIADRLQKWLSNGIEAPIAPAPQTPTPATPASVVELPWTFKDGVLTCQPLSAQKRESKENKKEFVAVRLNRKHEGQDTAFCWQPDLFNALLACPNKPASLRVDMSGKYLNVVDVLMIDGEEYRDGIPWVDPEDEAEPVVAGGDASNDSLFITDDDIPF